MSEHKSVTQAWLGDLPLMQQTVLLTAVRGPDGIGKNHVAKKLSRWLRRCVLRIALDRGSVRALPFNPIGTHWRTGSFTGESCYEMETGRAYVVDREEKDILYPTWEQAMWEVLRRYVVTLDELPHHFQLHFMHAAEILGYKHPSSDVREWWRFAYEALANDMHLLPEGEEAMDKRLGDDEGNWRAAERGMTADA